MPAPPRRSIRRRLLLILSASGAFAWLLSAAGVFWVASRDGAVAADAIIVLGAAQYQGKPSPVLRTRLDHAIGLYARGLAPRLVLTGGIAEGDTESEAAVSREYALRAGVPDSAILLENDGRTTGQSLRAVGRLLGARGMRRAILVSDPFHLFRASLVARRQGLEVLTSPTRVDGVWTRLVRQPGYFLSETLKAPVAMVFDW